MTIELYASFLRYLTSAAGSFFIFQLLLGFINYRKLNDRHILWHIFMCFSTALYCFLLALNTHIVDIKSSNIILGMSWGVAFLAYYFYLKSLEAYFNEKIKLLWVVQVFCVSYFFMQAICNLIYLFTDYNFLFKVSESIGTSLFYKTMSTSVSPNIVGQLSGIIGALFVMFSSLIIWLYINKHERRETFLKVGIIVTLIVAFNDSAIGINATGAILPLFFLGNIFESIRFNFYYSKLSIEKMLTLENEVINLSKAAQFGFAAASIAHDIRNHIFVVDLATNKILKKPKEEDLILSNANTISKHNKKILEITDLYMDVFKNNFSSDRRNVSIRKIIEEAVDLVNDKVKEYGIDLILELDEDFEINCNQSEVTMSIVNLLRNSIDAIRSLEKYDKSWIKIFTSSKENFVEVVDCGNGIKKEIEGSIFELGFSTKKQESGNGIGLAITKQLLNRSGFKLELASGAPNTTFRISF